MSEKSEMPQFAMLKRYPVTADPPPFPWTPYWPSGPVTPKIPEVFDPVTTIYGPLLEKLKRERLVEVLRVKAMAMQKIQQAQMKYQQQVSKARMSLQQEISEIQQDLVGKVSQQLR